VTTDRRGTTRTRARAPGVEDTQPPRRCIGGPDPTQSGYMWAAARCTKVERKGADDQSIPGAGLSRATASFEAPHRGPLLAGAADLRDTCLGPHRARPHADQPRRGRAAPSLPSRPQGNRLGGICLIRLRVRVLPALARSMTATQAPLSLRGHSLRGRSSAIPVPRARNRAEPHPRTSVSSSSQ
jgi:hypothetical protein